MIKKEQLTRDVAKKTVKKIVALVSLLDSVG
jgi:hypothetical protein